MASTQVVQTPAGPPTEVSETAQLQTKLVVKEGDLRVEQVSAAEIQTNDATPHQTMVRKYPPLVHTPHQNYNPIFKPVLHTPPQLLAVPPHNTSTLDTSNITEPEPQSQQEEPQSQQEEPQAPPPSPDLLGLMGGMEGCSSWLLGYVASTNQYCRNENDVYNKLKREFSVFDPKDDVIRELRAVTLKIPLLEYEDEGVDVMYRTANPIRYMVDSCVTLHFFMKGSGGVDRIIRENHASWYEDESWEALDLPFDCFQKILKGKVYKAMNGAIAGKYTSWAGVKEFAQKHTYSANSHQIKFSDLYRLMKKDFAAPHDIIKHIKMEEVLQYCITTIPGLQITGEADDRKVVTDSDVLDLVMKVKHLHQSGVKNLAKEFAAFHRNCRDWTSYHMTYQKLNQHFRNVLNPNINKRRSKSAIQEEQKIEISSTVLDSSSKYKHTYQAIGINTVVEKKNRGQRENEDRHVTYNEQGQSRSRANSLTDREESSVVYLNTDKRSVVTVVGLPGTGKTTTLATLLGRAHNKDTPSTVLVISSSCCTTSKLLEFTSGVYVRACPVMGGKKKAEEDAEFSDSSDSGHQEEEPSSDYENVDPPTHSPCEELEKPYSPTQEPLEDREMEEKKKAEESEKKEDTVTNSNKTKKEHEPRKEDASALDTKIEDEFEKKELPWVAYTDVTEVLNSDSEGRITVIHYPNYEDMDAEVICGTLETFCGIPSKYPKYLVIDNQDVLSHPCNSSTLDKLIETHRDRNMSVWVAGTSPNSLPINLMDYCTLAVLHQFTSKYWYSELSDHLPVNSTTFQQCQGLRPGHCVMVAPGSHMSYPLHSTSQCYPCVIVPPKPISQ